AVIDRPRLLALVDRRVKIDVVPAGLSGRLHDDLDVALAVEAARIAAVAVVIDDRVDVGGLAPTDTFEMDPERGLDRPAGDIERQRRRGDPPRSSGALKWNSTLPAASAVASATTRERSSQPPVEAERSPLPDSMRDATVLTTASPLMRLP